MTNELTKNLYCIQIRSGVEIWIEKGRADNLRVILNNDPPRFIEFEERIINTADIVGLFAPIDMSDLTRRRSRQYKCRWSNWHDRGEKCECVDPIKKAEKERYVKEFYKKNGYYPL